MVGLNFLVARSRVPLGNYSSPSSLPRPISTGGWGWFSFPPPDPITKSVSVTTHLQFTNGATHMAVKTKKPSKYLHHHHNTKTKTKSDKRTHIIMSLVPIFLCLFFSFCKKTPFTFQFPPPFHPPPSTFFLTPIIAPTPPPIQHISST